MSTALIQRKAPHVGTPSPAGRDPYVDLVRAGALLVVVLWHWVFSIPVLTATSVSATNPIATTPGAWAATWVLQVMPVFFMVGGFAHRKNLERPGARGCEFVARRLRRLVPPALVVVAVWAGIGYGLDAAGFAWGTSAAVFAVSPLWFLAVYTILVLIAPLAMALHRRLGVLAPVVLAATAAVLDVARFAAGAGWAGWLNFLVIWAFAHQVGFSYDRLAAAGRRAGWAMTAAGIASLAILTAAGPYPASMVGVPGAPFSNMNPPTLAIVALAVFQTGLILLARPLVSRLLATKTSWRKVSGWINANALPLYLVHLTPWLVMIGAAVAVLGWQPPTAPTPGWWLARPVWLAVPAVLTYPLLRLYRLTARRR